LLEKSWLPVGEIPEQLQAVVCAFLRMALQRKNISVCYRRGKALAIVRRTTSLIYMQRIDKVAMNKVKERAILNASP